MFICEYINIFPRKFHNTKTDTKNRVRLSYYYILCWFFLPMKRDAEGVVPYKTSNIKAVIHALKHFTIVQNNHFTTDRSFHKFALADLFHCVTLRLCNEGCRLRAEIFDFLSSPYLRTAEEKSEIINHIYEEKRSFST